MLVRLQQPLSQANRPAIKYISKRSHHRNMSISPPPLKRQRVGNEDRVTSANETTCDQNKLQIYSWNINGIQPFIQRPITSFFQPKPVLKKPNTGTAKNDGTPVASLRDFLRRHNWPTILFLQEVKINPDDTATQTAVEKAVQSNSKKDTKESEQEPDYVTHFCLPSDLHNVRGFGRKLYGVCTLVRKDFFTKHNARFRTVDWDREGRFSILETENPKLSVWNIYAVNGTDNVYKDSDTGVMTGTRHDRKLAVHGLVLEESRWLEGMGYSVVLAGDMNIAPGVLDGHPNLRVYPEQHVRNRADFNKKFFDDDDDGDGLKAIDTFRHVHGDKRAYTYHPRNKPFGASCDRVDLIICSRDLGDCIEDAGVLDTPAERGPSDHCPLFAVFDLRRKS